MKKALLLASLAMGAFATALAIDYPKPVERRIPWTIIAGSEKADVANPVEGNTTGAAADLIDRNPLTYWTSDASVCDATNADHLHWFLIDRGIDADQAPFDKISLRQLIVQTGDADDTTAEWLGAVDKADIYVSDEYMGLAGGSDNAEYDNEILMSYVANYNATLSVSMEIFTQECQIFNFPERQTGRYVLVVITHSVNPNGDQNQNDKYAALAEVDLFTNDNLVVSNFSGSYALGENPENEASATKRTHYLTFSNDFSDQWRSTPFLQSTSTYDPYTDNLNWLEWDKTYFDVTSLYTFRAGIGKTFDINPSAVGDGMYQAFYIDWEGNGFDDNEAVAKTDVEGELGAMLTVSVPADKVAGIYRARYIADTQNTSATPSAGIKEGGIVVDFYVEIGNQVTFTAKMMYDGLMVESRSVTGYAGTPFSIASPDFFDVPVVGVTPETDGAEVEFVMSRLNLPFAYTTLQEGETLDPANLKWQAITHSFSAPKLWSYATEGNDAHTIAVGNAPANISTEGYTDNQLWAFVGDIVNGFKVYNKAAGVDEWLYAENANLEAKMGISETNNLWKPYVIRSADSSTAPPAQNRPSHKYCYLWAKTCNDGSNEPDFLNPAGGLVKHYGNKDDNGSTMSFTAVNTPLLRTVTDYTFDEAGANFVGEYILTGTEHVEEPVELVHNATANPYDAQYAEQLRELIDKYEESKTQVPMALNKWYRFKNVSESYNLNTCWMTINTSNDEFKGTRYESAAQTIKSDYNNLFFAEQIEEGETGTGVNKHFYLYSQGKYVSKVLDPLPSSDTKSGDAYFKQVDKPADAGQYFIQSRNGAALAGQQMNSPAIWSIYDNTFSDVKKCINLMASTKLANWGPATPSVCWNIAPAEDIDVNLTKLHDGENVSFGCFPFDVTSNDASKLYEVFPALEGEKPVLSYREVSTVKAGKAFMIRNKEYNIANLKIVYDDAPAAANLYFDGEGTTTPAAHVLAGAYLNATALAGDFVLDPNSADVEFKKAESDTTVGGNYAYIPANLLPDTHSGADVLMFAADTSTAIEEVTAESVRPVAEGIYDLQGRKLAAPAKGINIVNGRKVLVK